MDPNEAATLEFRFDPFLLCSMTFDPVTYNREAWDQQVAAENQWTQPVSSEVIAKARQGDWSVVLTPRKPVPRAWFGELQDKQVLGLASAGGQQGPVLAAAGARVTVFDNSSRQLAQDRTVADRDNLPIETMQGDMQDLSALEDDRFDLVFHPVSNCFVPDVVSVWRHVARVLKPGGALLAGFANPIIYSFGLTELKQQRLVLKYPLPTSEFELTDEDRAHLPPDEPLGFSHTLESQIGGQLAAGLMLTDLFEDGFGGGDADEKLLDSFFPSFIATRAIKAAT